MGTQPGTEGDGTSGNLRAGVCPGATRSSLVRDESPGAAPTRQAGSEAGNTTHLSPPSSGGQKSEMSLTGLRPRCWQDWILLDAQGRGDPVSLTSPASPGPRSFPHLQGGENTRPSQILTSASVLTLSDPPSSLPLIRNLMMTGGPPPNHQDHPAPISTVPTAT